MPVARKLYVCWRKEKQYSFFRQYVTILFSALTRMFPKPTFAP